MPEGIFQIFIAGLTFNHWPHDLFGLHPNHILRGQCLPCHKIRDCIHCATTAFVLVSIIPISKRRRELGLFERRRHSIVVVIVGGSIIIFIFMHTFFPWFYLFGGLPASYIYIGVDTNTKTVNSPEKLAVCFLLLLLKSNSLLTSFLF